MSTVERLEILKETLLKHYDTDIVNNLLKRISDLEFDVEEKEQDLELYKQIGIMHYERPYAKRYLEEKRKERKDLLYPDSEQIYKDYYEAKEEIERLQKENEILRHRLEVANEYIDDRKENMIIDHVIDLKYIINECDLDSTW